MSKFLLASLLVFSAASAHAQRRRAVEPGAESRVSYDLSASTGSYNDATYTEITLGLNWFVQDWLNWRNAVFSRQGSGIESVQGLDSSLRLSTSVRTESGSFGVDAFVGPGLRLAAKDNNAVFGEAGLVFKLGGLRIGAGAKALNYLSTRTDSAGASLPKNDTQYFLILGGSGTL